MQKNFSNKPLLRIAAIFLLFFITPMLLSTQFGYQTAAGYIAPLVLLTLTWFLFKKEGETIAAIGLKPTGKNLLFLPMGILLGILFLSFTLFIQLWHDGFSIELNKNANLLQIAGGVFFLLQGVLNEELIFRGYCLTKTVKQTGFVKANIIFAMLFVLWHFISWNAWGHPGMMLGAITTAFGHLLFAMALYRSGTLFFPIGIHLGINWASRYLFSIVKNGNESATDVLFLVKGSNENASNLHLIINYGITVIGFIILTWLLWKWNSKNSMQFKL